MSKTLNDVKLNVSGIGKMSDRILLNNSENLSIALSKINTYLNDLKSGAFTTAYTHPTYTSKSSGLYKITVDGTGHVSAATAATGTDLPSHTHAYIPLSGSDSISGNLKMNSKYKGYFLIDKNDTSYPGIIDNSTNLWIGAGATSGRHHVGGTFISSGYDSANGTGYSTISVSVPNATNDNATNYKVLHNGNTSFTPSQTSGNKVGTLVINDISNDIYANDDTLLQSNSVTSNFRPIILGTTSSSSHGNLNTSVTGQGYVNPNIFAKPDTGNLYANTFTTTSRVDTGNGAMLSNNALNFRLKYTNSAGTTYDMNRNCVRIANGGVTASNGFGLYIDSAGLTVIGGGESAGNLAALIDADQSVSGAAKLNVSGTTTNFTQITNDSEQLVLSSDNNIYFVTKCNTIANRTAVVLDANKTFHPDVTGSGSLGIATYHWGSAYIDTINGNLTGNVNHTLTNPTTETAYGLTFHDGEGSTGTKGLLTNAAARVTIKHVTTGGHAIFTAGDATTAASGGKFGVFRAYCSDTTYSQFSGGVSVGETGLIFRTSTNVNGDYLRPYSSNTYDLGTSLYRWRNVYATTLNGDLIGNVTGDVTGDIKHTLTNSSTEGTYGLTFHSTAGTTGVKTLRTNDGITTTIKYSSAGGYSILNLGDATAASSGGKNGIIKLYGETANRFCTLTCTGTKNLILDNDSGTGGTNFSPAVTNTYDLGTTSLKWRNVYATTLNGSLDPSNLSSAVPTSKGGTGLTSITTNAFLTGYGTNAVRLVETKNGALYATASGEVAQFGKLPVAQGGTGSTRLTSGEVLVGNGTGAIQTRAIATTATSGSTALITSGAVYSALDGPYVGFKVYKLYPKDYTWKAVGSSGNRIWYISSAINVSADFVKVFGACICNFGGCKTWICLPYSASATTFNANLIDMSGGTTNPGTYFESLTSAYFDIKVFGVTKTSLP